MNLKIILSISFIISFLIKLEAQDSLPRLKINTINGIIQTDNSTRLDLRFADISQNSYNKLLTKVSSQKDFDLIKNGFNPEYNMAQLKLSSMGFKSLDQVEKFILTMGFSKIIVDSKEINTSSLSESYKLNTEKLHINSEIK